MSLIFLVIFTISLVAFLALVYLWYPLLVKLPTIFRVHLPVAPIVIFESDDWGGYRDIDFYPNTNSDKDCLESTDELNQLYELLREYRDTSGRRAIFYIKRSA